MDPAKRGGCKSLAFEINPPVGSHWGKAKIGREVKCNESREMRICLDINLAGEIDSPDEKEVLG